MREYCELYYPDHELYALYASRAPSAVAAASVPRAAAQVRKKTDDA